ncbi:MAG: hypothetical protein WCN98_20390, partial [Verrucomicrobiaceae bacterium]
TQNIGNAADSADPNRNGIPNLLEYALGGNPIGSTPGTSILPVVAVSPFGNHLQISFTRSTSITDITYVVEATNDLSTPWTTLATSINSDSFTTVEPGTTISSSGPPSTRRFTIVDPVTIGSSGQLRRFLRLRIPR